MKKWFRFLTKEGRREIKIDKAIKIFENKFDNLYVEYVVIPAKKAEAALNVWGKIKESKERIIEKYSNQKKN